MRRERSTACVSTPRRLSHFCLLIVILAPCFAATADGRPRYELGDDETWSPQTVHAANSPEGQLDTIRRLIVKERGREAFEAADQWIETHADHPLLAEAYLLRGDAWVARRRYYKALYDYEYVLRSFPDSDQFFVALQREFKIAQLFSNGMRRKLFGMRLLAADGEAEELFIRIQERAPGSAIGEKASLALGDHYFNRAEMTNAAEAYDLFLINYPRSLKREKAMLQLIRANLATFKGPRFDASGLIEAAQRLKTYRAEFAAGAEQLGADALLVRIDESLALKDYYTARWYEQRGQRVSAVALYERVVRDYPQTAPAERSLDAYRQLRSSLDPTTNTATNWQEPETTGAPEGDTAATEITP